MIKAFLDRLEQAGQNLGRVFNSRSGCIRSMKFFCCVIKLTNLKLKTRSKQHLRSLPLDITIPNQTFILTLKILNINAQRHCRELDQAKIP
jgi:hypothetical protein